MLNETFSVIFKHRAQHKSNESKVTETTFKKLRNKLRTIQLWSHESSAVNLHSSSFFLPPIFHESWKRVTFCWQDKNAKFSPPSSFLNFQLVLHGKNILPDVKSWVEKTTQLPFQIDFILAWNFLFWYISKTDFGAKIVMYQTFNFFLAWKLLLSNPLKLILAWKLLLFVLI